MRSRTDDDRASAHTYRCCMRKLVIVGILVTASTAAAQARYTRKQPVAVPVKLSDRVKPVPAAKQDQPKPITADAVLAITELQQPLRREQEALLEKLIKDTPDDDADKPDYLFRLAEQYAKQMQFWRLKSVEAQLK
jgi:hypothetical protein